jgi:hypothetical protein
MVDVWNMSRVCKFFNVRLGKRVLEKMLYERVMEAAKRELGQDFPAIMQESGAVICGAFILDVAHMENSGTGIDIMISCRDYNNMRYFQKKYNLMAIPSYADGDAVCCVAAAGSKLKIVDVRVTADEYIRAAGFDFYRNWVGANDFYVENILSILTKRTYFYLPNLKNHVRVRDKYFMRGYRFYPKYDMVYYLEFLILQRYYDKIYYVDKVPTRYEVKLFEGLFKGPPIVQFNNNIYIHNSYPRMDEIFMKRQTAWQLKDILSRLADVEEYCSYLSALR